MMVRGTATKTIGVDRNRNTEPKYAYLRLERECDRLEYILECLHTHLIY